MNYSVVRSGSKQYIVEKGDIIDVELLDSPGKKVVFETLLRVNGDDVEFGEPVLEAGSEAEVVEEMVKGKKKQAVKYNQGGYRRKFGHRQKYTRLKVTKV